MTVRYYSSVAAETTLNGSITAGNTSIQVASVTGFPALTPYTLALDYESANEELVEVTNAAGTTLTVTRAIDSTSAGSHNAGARVRHVSSARDFTDSRNHENSTMDVHGIDPTSDVVGTNDTQTLSNKTLTAPTINGTVGGTASFSNTTINNGTLTGTVSGNPTFDGEPNFEQANFVAPAAAVVPVQVVGAASQTAALQQWMDNTPTVVAEIEANGRIDALNGITANPDGDNSVPLRVEVPSTQLEDAVQVAVNGVDKVVVANQGELNAFNTIFVTTDGSDVPLTVRYNGSGGVPPSSQEWENAAGTTVASMDNEGLLTTEDAVIVNHLTVLGTTDLGGTAYKTSDTTRTATTILSDPALVIGVEPNTDYTIEGLLIVRGDLNGDINIGWSSPAGSTGFWTPIGFPTGTSTNSGSVEIVASTISSMRSFGLHATPSTSYGIHINGFLDTAGTAGNLTLQWGAATGGGTGSTLGLGSWIRLTRL